jgi:YD repeat-containing protein
MATIVATGPRLGEHGATNVEEVGMSRARATQIASIAAAFAAMHSAPASAGQWMCVPDTAGAAVTSGGASGSCTGATAVKVPASAADQQTLIDLLPYVKFRSVGIGSKPTVVFTGINVHVVKRDDTDVSGKDGTGNIVVGRDYNPFQYGRAGSENLIVGIGHGWNVNGNLLAGAYNYAEGGSYGFAAGASNHLIEGASPSILGGFANYAKGNYSTVVGGRNRTVTGQYQYLADDVHWVRYDGSGKVVASSDPTSSITSYTSPYYSLTSFGDRDLGKCSITAQVEGPDGQVTTAVAAPYYTTYAYVRFNKVNSASSTGASTATSVPHTVTVSCGKNG